jgi:hypothetical protein
MLFKMRCYLRSRSDSGTLSLNISLHSIWLTFVNTLFTFVNTCRRTERLSTHGHSPSEGSLHGVGSTSTSSDRRRGTVQIRHARERPTSFYHHVFCRLYCSQDQSCTSASREGRWRPNSEVRIILFEYAPYWYGSFYTYFVRLTALVATLPSLYWSCHPREEYAKLFARDPVWAAMAMKDKPSPRTHEESMREGKRVANGDFMLISSPKVYAGGTKWHRTNTISPTSSPTWSSISLLHQERQGLRWKDPV